MLLAVNSDSKGNVDVKTKLRKIPFQVVDSPLRVLVKLLSWLAAKPLSKSQWVSLLREIRPGFMLALK